MSKIKVNGISLYYEIHGQGHPIVFVSGFSGDHSAWQDIIKTYADSYQVIVFDNRGIGGSDAPHYSYTTEMMADDVAGLIKELKLEKPHIVGHSFGGSIVQTVLRNHHDLIRSAVIVCSTAKWNTRSTLYIEGRLKLIEADAVNKGASEFITLMCWSENYLSKPDMAKQLVEAGFFPITITGYKGQMNAALSFDSRKWLHKIRTPCLVVGADDDLFVSVKETEWLAAKIPNTEYYCFKDIGHIPFVEQPNEFNDLVLEFIGKHNEDVK